MQYSRNVKVFEVGSKQYLINTKTGEVISLRDDLHENIMKYNPGTEITDMEMEEVLAYLKDNDYFIKDYVIPGPKKDENAYRFFVNIPGKDSEFDSPKVVEDVTRILQSIENRDEEFEVILFDSMGFDINKIEEINELVELLNREKIKTSLLVSNIDLNLFDKVKNISSIGFRVKAEDFNGFVTEKLNEIIELKFQGYQVDFNILTDEGSLESLNDVFKILHFNNLTFDRNLVFNIELVESLESTSFCKKPISYFGRVLEFIQENPQLTMFNFYSSAEINSIFRFIRNRQNIMIPEFYCDNYTQNIIYSQGKEYRCWNDFESSRNSISYKDSNNNIELLKECCYECDYLSFCKGGCLKREDNCISEWEEYFKLGLGFINEEESEDGLL